MYTPVYVVSVVCVCVVVVVCVVSLVSLVNHNKIHNKTRLTPPCENQPTRGTLWVC